MTREKSQAVLRALHAEAQDAVKPPAGIEHVALTAVDELERALKRNAILEQKVKRLEFRLTSLEGAAQGMARRLIAYHATTPENLKTIAALNEETAVQVALDVMEREKKAAPYKRVTCQCGQRDQRRNGYDCEHCDKWSCAGCHTTYEGKCAHCGQREVHDPT